MGARAVERRRLVALGTLLDQSALTIGLAGRFTQDLRADFAFDDPQRLASILTAARRPVQLVFAGRAYRGDEAGKHHLQRLFMRALDPAFGGRIAFLEDYDLHAARLLVQGCDVWLSTPPDGAVPPLAALKAAVNGVPHLATPAAASDAVPGWTVSDPRALYQVLEDDIVPAFYTRDRAGIPSLWLGYVRTSLGRAVPRVTARRNVKTGVDQTAALRV